MRLAKVVYVTVENTRTNEEYLFVQDKPEVLEVGETKKVGIYHLVEIKTLANKTELIK
jgi:hypothetical protein